MLEMRNNQMQILLSGPEREYKPVIEFEGSVATHRGLRLDAERTLRRPIGLPQQKSAQACMIARRRSKLSVRR
jgi:hypothetical protein